MATSTHNRAFQAYNNYTFNNHPSLKRTSMSTAGESSIFSHIAYSSIKASVDKTPPTPPSPSPSNNLVKQASVTAKRRASTASLGYFLPRRKSLQMTALASQRQSLWMSIAKNGQNSDTSTTPMPPAQPPTSLMRKKLLRLLLVFSYLLSISLFAIALATFYGFFWTGYNVSPTSVSPSSVGSTVSSAISLTQNSTLIDIGLSLEEDVVFRT